MQWCSFSLSEGSTSRKAAASTGKDLTSSQAVLSAGGKGEAITVVLVTASTIDAVALTKYVCFDEEWWRNGAGVSRVPFGHYKMALEAAVRLWRAPGVRSDSSMYLDGCEAEWWHVLWV